MKSKVLTGVEGIHGRNIQLSVDLGFITRHTSVGPGSLDSFSLGLLDYFRQAIGRENSVMVAAYNFDFGEKQFFSSDSSPSHVGRFSTTLLRHPDAFRTLIPFYSFLVFGPHKEKLHPYPYVRSTGKASPFEFQVEEKYLLVAIGHHASKALTIVHHAEDLAQVAWRHSVWRVGDVMGIDGKIRRLRVQFYARNSGVKFSGLTILGDQIMREKGVIRHRRVDFDGLSLPCEVVDLAALTSELSASLSAGSNKLVSPMTELETSDFFLTGQVADHAFMQGLRESNGLGIS